MRVTSSCDSAAAGPRRQVSQAPRAGRFPGFPRLAWRHSRLFSLGVAGFRGFLTWRGGIPTFSRLAWTDDEVFSLGVADSRENAFRVARQTRFAGKSPHETQKAGNAPPRNAMAKDPRLSTREGPCAPSGPCHAGTPTPVAIRPCLAGAPAPVASRAHAHPPHAAHSSAKTENPSFTAA